MGKRGNSQLGFHRDELTAVLRSSVAALRNRAEFPWNSAPAFWKSEFQRCRTAGISILGLFPADCPYSAVAIPAGEEASEAPPSERLCQLNRTAVRLVLELAENCGDLEVLALRDQGLESREIREILRFFLDRGERFPRFRLLQVGGSFIDREESREIGALIGELEARGVSVDGVALFASGRFAALRCRRNARRGVFLGADEPSVPRAGRVRRYFWNSGVTEIGPISDETMERLVAVSPFRFAAKIALQNACGLHSMGCERRHREPAGM